METSVVAEASHSLAFGREATLLENITEKALPLSQVPAVPPHLLVRGGEAHKRDRQPQLHRSVPHALRNGESAAQFLPSPHLDRGRSDELSEKGV